MGDSKGTGARTRDLLGAALVAFGQGSGRIAITPRAVRLIEKAYEKSIDDNREYVEQNYRAFLAAARDLGAFSVTAARRKKLTSTIRGTDVSDAIKAIDKEGPLVSCPLCARQE